MQRFLQFLLCFSLLVASNTSFSQAKKYFYKIFLRGSEVVVEEKGPLQTLIEVVEKSNDAIDIYNYFSEKANKNKVLTYESNTQLTGADLVRKEAWDKLHEQTISRIQSAAKANVSTTEKEMLDDLKKIKPKPTFWETTYEDSLLNSFIHCKLLVGIPETKKEFIYYYGSHDAGQLEIAKRVAKKIKSKKNKNIFFIKSKYEFFEHLKGFNAPSVPFLLDFKSSRTLYPISSGEKIKAVEIDSVLISQNAIGISSTINYVDFFRQTDNKYYQQLTYKEAFNLTSFLDIFCRKHDFSSFLKSDSLVILLDSFLNEKAGLFLFERYRMQFGHYDKDKFQLKFNVNKFPGNEGAGIFGLYTISIVWAEKPKVKSKRK